MNRYMFTGFIGAKNVRIKKDKNVHFSVIGYFEDKVFIYMETPEKIDDADAEKYVIGGNLKRFPDGRKLWRMERVFYCDPYLNDEIFNVTEQVRNPDMGILNLEHDEAFLAYVGHHYVLQEYGKTVWDRYYSIYSFGNIFISIAEKKPVPSAKRESPFKVPVRSIIKATMPVIDGGKKQNPDGSYGWYKIN